mgnify:CR=1 FL=1
MKFCINIFLLHLSALGLQKFRGAEKLAGRLTDCETRGDKAGNVEKYLVFPDFPKPVKTQTTCTWHITSGKYLRISYVSAK